MRITGPLLFLALSVLPGSAAAAAFHDVPSTHPKAEAIAYVRQKGIMSGYADGTFRPERTLNRAELVKVLLSASPNEEKAEDCLASRFNDVPKNAWFSTWVCLARRRGLVKGYADHTFRPGEKVTLAEAAAMIVRIENMAVEDGSPWYRAPLAALAARKVLPSDSASWQSNLTRGDVAELLWRLQDHHPSEDQPSLEDLLASRCRWFTEEPIPGVDLEEVRRVWLQWTNAVRAEQGAPALMEDRQLVRSATLWAVHGRDAGAISHTRPGQTSYYDYARMVQWFQGLGLTFRNVERITFTESIGWGTVRCQTGDCTERFLEAIRSTFDFYVAERDKQSRAHWNSLIQPRFEREGLGIAMNAEKGTYYLTVHYGTSFVDKPEPLCP